MTVLINIVLILISIVLIIAVLMQEGNKQGLGAIGGAAETFLGKNKSKSYEGKLLTITKICAAVFVVIAILATWLNARTYTVKYFDEEGNEYFPKAYNQALISNLLNGTEYTYEDAVEMMGEKEARASYGAGDTIIAYGTPVKEGYVGHWDKELPEKMGHSNYELKPIYEIGEYTLNVLEITVPDENGDTETKEHYTVTALYQTEIDAAAVQAAIDEIPEVEGYIRTVNGEVPDTMPGQNTSIIVSYTAIAEEETEAEEPAPEAEPAETEAAPEVTDEAAEEPATEPAE